VNVWLTVKFQEFIDRLGEQGALVLRLIYERLEVLPKVLRGSNVTIRTACLSGTDDLPMSVFNSWPSVSVRNTQRVMDLNVELLYAYDLTIYLVT